MEFFHTARCRAKLFHLDVPSKPFCWQLTIGQFEVRLGQKESILVKLMFQSFNVKILSLFFTFP